MSSWLASLPQGWKRWWWREEIWIWTHGNDSENKRGNFAVWTSGTDGPLARKRTASKFWHSQKLERSVRFDPRMSRPIIQRQNFTQKWPMLAKCISLHDEWLVTWQSYRLSFTENLHPAAGIFHSSCGTPLQGALLNWDFTVPIPSKIFPHRHGEFRVRHHILLIVTQILFVTFVLLIVYSITCLILQSSILFTFQIPNAVFPTLLESPFKIPLSYHPVNFLMQYSVKYRHLSSPSDISPD